MTLERSTGHVFLRNTTRCPLQTFTMRAPLRADPRPSVAADGHVVALPGLQCSVIRFPSLNTQREVCPEQLVSVVTAPLGATAL